MRDLTFGPRGGDLGAGLGGVPAGDRVAGVLAVGVLLGQQAAQPGAVLDRQPVHDRVGDQGQDAGLAKVEGGQPIGGGKAHLAVTSCEVAAHRKGWMTASQSARSRRRVVATVAMHRSQQMAQPALVRTTYR
jgi:hypothetical protein